MTPIVTRIIIGFGTAITEVINSREIETTAATTVGVAGTWAAAEIVSSVKNKEIEKVKEKAKILKKENEKNQNNLDRTKTTAEKLEKQTLNLEKRIKNNDPLAPIIVQADPNNDPLPIVHTTIMVGKTTFNMIVPSLGFTITSRLFIL